MLTEENIKRLAAQILEGTPFYVTAVNVGAGHQVSVRIDGDQGVTVKDCADLSRKISAALEREHDDFSLEVSSHGATSPLLMPRQYRRHIGRTLEIRLTDGTRAEGTLGEVADDHIGIAFTVRENKPVGKGKITVEKRRDIRFEEMAEARIKLKY